MAFSAATMSSGKTLLDFLAASLLVSPAPEIRQVFDPGAETGPSGGEHGALLALFSIHATDNWIGRRAHMQLTPTITFRGIDPSAALEAEIRTRIGKLETYYRPIMGCRVLVELAERHHETGNRYHVRLDVTAPGEEIVVTHEAALHATARDFDAEKATKEAEPDPERKHARVAVREAFDIARRRLQDYGRRQRGTVKATARQPRGRVAQLFPIDEYGYIEAEDGHEVYFQKSSVLKISTV
jgi:ribosome-associated translation inhibitor RaiA